MGTVYLLYLVLFSNVFFFFFFNKYFLRLNLCFLEMKFGRYPNSTQN